MDAILIMQKELHKSIVSIHAPVMDAIGITALMRLFTCCFNPRARDGRDVLLGTVA